MTSHHPTRTTLLAAMSALLFISNTTLAADDTASDKPPVITSGKVIFLKSGEDVEPIIIEEDGSISLEHEHRIVRVDGFEPDSLSVEALNPKRLRIKAVDAMSKQTLLLTDEFDNRLSIEIDIVSHSIRRLSKYLRQLFPDAKLELYDLNGSLLIRGTAPSAEELMEIYEVAEEFSPNVLKHAKLEGYENSLSRGQIPPGMRVITVRVNESQGLTHHLGPGDRVDITVSYQKRDARGLNTHGRVLLEYVPIFAPPTFMDGEQGARVSLLVTPEQASYVQLAEKKGDLSLVLRRRLDDEQMQAGAIDSTLLEELTGLPDQSATHDSASPQEDDESVTETETANNLQSEIRALHADVKRLIELLEQRQAGEKRPVEELAIPRRDFPKPATSSREPEVSTPLDVKLSTGPAGTFSGRIRLVGDVPRLEPLVKAENLSQRARKCTDEDIPDESLLVGSNGGLANVFVFPAQLPEDIDVSPYYPSPTPLTSRACRFVPHCSIVRVGQTVLLKNDDPIMCNVHTSPLRNPAVNQAIAPNEATGVEISYERTEPTVTRILDDLYPWKSAYQLVVDHNFATLTNDEGYFEVPELPPGEYRFVFWHEKLGYLHANFPITIKPDEGVDVEITSDAEPASQPSKPEVFGVEYDF
ncbi:MAG: hypothetical protein KDA93_15950 [Planctomycetaceae bacterium]|nr:hypothetical protein [Planctomycetaceae bacterium]